MPCSVTLVRKGDDLHAQLASAVGATRTTVTRLLGQLRRRGILLAVPAEGGERFCLPDQKDGRN